MLLKNNSYGLAGSEVVEGLGLDAAEFVRLTDLSVFTLNSAVPGTVPTETGQTADNETGVDQTHKRE